MKLIPALVLLAFAGTASASSFQLQNQTGSGNGNAFAGAAATAEDAGTIFFNPAGMTYLPEGHNIAAAGTILQRSLKFSNTGTNQLNLGAGPFALGSNGGNAGGVAFIPAGYYAYSISPALRVGLGVSPTFGNRTEYDNDFMGRFQGTMSDIQGININPSIAYRVNEVVSLGFGLNFTHASMEIEGAVPTGATTEGKTSYKGTDWGYGYNLGAMFQVSPSTRLGLSYRSQTKVELDGDLKVNGTTRANGAGTKIRATLPDTFSLAVSQKLSDRWEMLGDVTWTGWSSVPELKLDFNDGTNSAEALGFKNTWRIGLGANYQLNDAWKLRFGVAHDKTPVPNAELRTVRLPDADRTWLSVGAKYKLSNTSSLDFGYTHIFFSGESINRQTSVGNVGRNQFVRGNYDISANLLSVQYNMNF